MRTTNLLRNILGLQHTRVVAATFGEDGLVVDVAPTWRVPRCGECRRKAAAVYDHRERTWRHLDLGGMMTWLRHKQRRVVCRRCGVRVEAVPWAEPASNFTLPFENQAAFLAQKCDRTTVTKLMRIAWRTVGGVISRVVRRKEAHQPDPLDGLRIIGVDELSYRKHHQYITIVTDHVTGRIIWAAEGKSADTLAQFFDRLGAARCRALEAVTLDLSAAYAKAVRSAAPQAKLIFDRFHVQKLVHDALDEVRRSLVREVSNSTEKKVIKKSRWALQKNPWNLNATERTKLEEIEKLNAPLYRAYLLKESILDILDGRQINVARAKLLDWLNWATNSGLDSFAKLASTVQRHMDGILEYVRTRLSNGRIEGLNGKARTITRRAYGFHSASSLIAMLFLCCGGFRLEPAHILPFSTH